MTKITLHTISVSDYDFITIRSFQKLRKKNNQYRMKNGNNRTALRSVFFSVDDRLGLKLRRVQRIARYESFCLVQGFGTLHNCFSSHTNSSCFGSFRDCRKSKINMSISLSMMILDKP